MQTLWFEYVLGEQMQMIYDVVTTSGCSAFGSSGFLSDMLAPRSI